MSNIKYKNIFQEWGYKTESNVETVHVKLVYRNENKSAQGNSPFTFDIDINHISIKSG